MNCFSHSLPWNFVHLLPGAHLPWHWLSYGLPHWQKTCFSLVSAPHLLLLRAVYILCQLKFTLSNLCAESKNVNIVQVCFLTLLVCLSSYCWKTLEHIEAYKTASVMSVQTILSADTIQRYLSFSWESRRSEVLEKPRQRKKKRKSRRTEQESRRNRGRGR